MSDLLFRTPRWKNPDLRFAVRDTGPFIAFKDRTMWIWSSRDTLPVVIGASDAKDLARVILENDING